ncbi:Inositol transport system permease protein [Rubellimicrobium mesophilum DSM 19309]|uniref:Xylose transport system permease protein XylH n=2 Tax=Rubellimicrobium TaxID=295418 RepID=A0A017HLM7_9RHOB|nr:Inositol transport system permease protein [Rubellimicrobium mesophilum DSM 19309]
MKAGMTDSRGAFGRVARRPETGSFLGLIITYAFFALFGGQVFITAPGWSSWLNAAAEVGIVALPVGLLMIAGLLDISVGAVLPASSLTVAIISGHYDLPLPLGIAGGLAIGLAVGWINGLLVTRTTIPSLIITIGTMFGVMGLTLGLTILIAGSTGVFIVPDVVTKSIFGSAINNMFQVVIFWWAGFVAAVFFLLHLSPWGNWVFALGGDRDSARNAGIPTDRVTIQLYMLSGFAAAFVGVTQVITFGSAQVAAGSSFIFNSIMCVVIGGVLLTGGAGSVVGIVLGTITFAIVNQGIFFTRLDPNIGSIIIGALLLIAVLTNDGFRKLALSASTKKA